MLMVSEGGDLPKEHLDWIKEHLQDNVVLKERYGYLQEVLELPLTKDTLPSVLKAAQYVLDHSMVQFPELSHRTVEMEVHKTSSNTVNVNAAPVLSKSDVMDAILIASKADGHRGSRSIEAIDLPEALV